MPDDQANLVHQLPETQKPAKKWLLFVAVFAFIIGAGALTGYLLSTRLAGKQAVGVKTTGSEIGSTDTKTFKDTAAGVLEKGGIDGEGTHKLIREGGPSQTAYLTSSVIDLDQFEGKKVQVWGETFSGQKAGWLMDIGRVKVLD